MDETRDAVTMLIQDKLGSCGMTVKELARALNVTDRTLHNRWHDSSGWTRQQLVELCKIFNLSKEEKLLLLEK